MKSLYFLIILIFCHFFAFPQFYELGQEPSKIKWQQIKSNNFSIVFPEGNNSDAQKFIKALEYLKLRDSGSFANKPIKFPVVMHYNQASPQGVVVWAPKRMEIFSLTPQESNYHNWLKQLAIHEYRHAVQVSRFNKGFTKFGSFLFGQQYLGGSFGLYSPMWFIEGDAVYAETVMSTSGRGRDPEFEMKTRTLFLSGHKYSYDKLFFGSYKNFVPSFYETGYNLVAYSRFKYGIDIWEKALDNSAKKPFFITPFGNSIKKSTGFYKAKLCKEVYRDLDSLWTIQDIRNELSFYSEISKPNKHYTSYRYPIFLNDSVLIALKSGINIVDRLISIDLNGNEETIYRLGNNRISNISTHGDKVVFTELESDIRWSNRSYSIIKILDCKTKKVKKLNNKSKYYYPSFSSDGKRILAIRIDEYGKSIIEELDANNGEVVNSVKPLNNEFLRTPIYGDVGKIIFVSVTNSGKEIIEIDLKTSSRKTLVQKTHFNISRLVWTDKYLFYNSTNSGINNFHALDYVKDSNYRITSSRFGAFDLCVNSSNDNIVYTDFTANGYKLVKSNLDETKWKSLNTINDESIRIYESLLDKDKYDFNIDSIEIPDFEVTKYSKFKNLINIHSWYPFYASELDYDLNIEKIKVNPGFTILSQNDLSTAFTNVGYGYENNEHFTFIKYTYKGWFPIIDLQAKYGGESVLNTSIPNSVTPKEKRLSFYSRIYVPFNFTKNKYIRSVTPSISTQYNNDSFLYEEINNKGLQHINYNLAINNFLNYSYKDLAPRFGQIVRIRYSNAPSDKNLVGEIFSIKSTLYLPGILKHHSVKLQHGHQKQTYSKFAYSNNVSFPRGYGGLTRTQVNEFSNKHDYNYMNNSFTSEDINRYSVDYMFPLLYPDLSVGPLMYIKRIRMNLFYDYVYANNLGKSNSFSSVGVDVNSDVQVLRFIFPFSIGVTIPYLIEYEQVLPRFIIDINISGI